MVQERVCIVLNEREPSKAKAAESLCERLKDYNITASRMSVEENTIEILKEKKPRIIVLDYLLGDYTTGLDILSAMCSLPQEKRPKTFFLTDEPSVQVAVDAMRLGALNYFELENPQAIGRLAREIHAAARATASQRTTIQHKTRLTFEDLIAQADSSSQLIREARAIARRRPQLVMIYGCAGSGRKTLASAISFDRDELCVEQLVDLLSYDAPIDDLFNELSELNTHSLHALHFLNAEEDDGSLLSALTKFFGKSRLNGNALSENLAITISTAQLATVQNWHKLLDFTVINIPQLAQHSDDIPFLVQRFVREAQELSDLKIKSFDAALMSWLGCLDWPGDIKQLRNCIIHSAIECTLSEQDPKRVIETQRELWLQERNSTNSLPPLDALTAALTLELAGFNYRIAAAKLGCSPSQLREMIK